MTEIAWKVCDNGHVWMKGGRGEWVDVLNRRGMFVRPPQWCLLTPEQMTLALAAYKRVGEEISERERLREFDEIKEMRDFVREVALANLPRGDSERAHDIVERAACIEADTVRANRLRRGDS